MGSQSVQKLSCMRKLIEQGKIVTRENKMAQLYCSTGLYHCLIEEPSKKDCASFLALPSECSDRKWIAEVQLQTSAVTPL